MMILSYPASMMLCPKTTRGSRGAVPFQNASTPASTDARRHNAIHDTRQATRSCAALLLSDRSALHSLPLLPRTSPPRPRTFVSVDLGDAVHGALVRLRVHALHPRLDDVERHGEDDADEARGAAGKHRLPRGDVRAAVGALDPLLEGFVRGEADALVPRLLRNRRQDAAVDAANAFLRHDRAHAVHEAAVLGVRAVLVVDQLRLHRLHGRHDERRLDHARRRARQHRAERRQLPFLIPQQPLHLLERREAHARLRHRPQHQGGQAPVQRREALLAHDCALRRGGDTEKHERERERERGGTRKAGDDTLLRHTMTPRRGGEQRGEQRGG